MKRLAIAMLALLSAAPLAAAPRPTLQNALRADLTKYLAARGSIEYISAASMSVNFTANVPNVDVAAGTTTYKGRVPVTPQNLFQIGSNTKAFTSVMLLQLEMRRKLTIEQQLGTLLPQYPAWKNINIRQLLNMTSGIPTYDDVDAVMARYAKNPTMFFSAKFLIAAVYPKTSFKPGAKWMYSNTAYLLGQTIVEKMTGNTYAQEFSSRFIDGGPRLTDMYYQANLYPPSITQRMVAGYFYSHDPGNKVLAPLLGRDQRNLSVSWAQGAGAAVSTPHALAQWVRALYSGPMLGDRQRRELMTIVSNKTGQPIASTSTKDPMGFGLGVGQLTKPGLGKIWYYEGETLGYRMLYAYFVNNGVVVTLGLNSQPDAKQDHIGQLLTSIASTLRGYGKM
jgi:D-alanyl-D-alanine carboxypeptidase